MSELKEVLLDNLLLARRNKHKSKLAFYQTFLGEVERVEKDSQKAIKDTQINKLATQWKKNLLETSTLAAQAGKESMLDMAAKELELIKDFLPVFPLKGETLLRVVHSIVDNLEDPNIGNIMKTLAINHKGLYDPSEAKGYIGELV